MVGSGQEFGHLRVIMDWLAGGDPLPAYTQPQTRKSVASGIARRFGKYWGGLRWSETFYRIRIVQTLHQHSRLTVSQSEQLRANFLVCVWMYARCAAFIRYNVWFGK